MGRQVPVVGLALLLTAGSGWAEEAPAPRKRIGLALGGGGARGGAHVGVLEVLEELHVPVDAIAGTSMGAVIGGLYAAGVPAERIHENLSTANWSDLLDDRPSYRELVFRRKEDAERYLVDFELGIRKGRIRLARGFRAGQKLAFEARAALVGLPPERDFSKFPIPFRAVATDVETGERVVLDHGDIVESILASFAVPGVFAPVEIDGRLLVDGGISDNLPVDIVREQGVDVVIAVDVGTPLVTRKDLRSAFGVLGQTTTFLTRKNTEPSLSAADLVLTPELEEISSADFAATAEAIERGRQAALAAREQLSRYALDEASWRAHVEARRVRPAEPRRISEIRVTGAEHVDPRLVLGRMRVKPGDTVDIAALRRDLVCVFGLDHFERVSLDVEPGPQGDAIVLHVKEKDWGPTYVRFGLEAVDDLEGDAQYAVRASITKTLLNRLGGEWRSDFQIGSVPIFRSELYQPLEFSGHLFVSPWIQIQRQHQGLFDETGQRIARYDIQLGSVALDLGVQFGSVGEMRLGLTRSHVKATPDTGAAGLPEFDVDGGGARFQLAISTVDRPAIPTHGGEIRAGVDLSRESLGADVDYDRAFLGGSLFFGAGRHTGFLVAQGASSLGSDIPIYDEFTLGGLFNLGGYSEGQFRGQYGGSMGAGYHFRIAALPAALGKGVYVGGIAEAGNAWATTAEISFDDLRYSFTAIVGADTILGPLFFAYAAGEGGSTQLYLTVGQTF
jgi:NTE family protein